MASTLGSALRVRRRALGLTQTEVARRVGVSQGLIAQLEGGRFRNPSLAVLRRLAEALSTTVGDLVS
jgi:transcriptional regulator with XRE-family HTH domain